MKKETQNRKSENPEKFSKSEIFLQKYFMNGTVHNIEKRTP